MKARSDDLIYADLVALTPKQLFGVYADMLPGEADGAAAAARALKDQARAGALDADPGTSIALLTFCLVDAPGPAAAFHLAKALAAFGRQAQRAAPYVVDHVLELRIVDDESFWVFDGLLYALGYLGGPAAKATLAAVAKDVPPRCARPGGIYDGVLSVRERESHHVLTLRNVEQLLSGPDPGPWRGKQSDLQRQAPAGTKQKKSAWQLRR